MLPPVVFPDDWTQEDYRIIGGFLLYFRAGILRALQSSRDSTYDQSPELAEGQRRYYEDAESVTRWLLSYTPYPVEKDQLWNAAKQYYPAPGGSLGRSF